MAGMIAQEVERIKSTVFLRTLDESATKQGVVLRLLSLAGWDTFDVSEVVPEHTVGNRRVDYALRPGSPNAVFSRSNASARIWIDTNSSYWSIASRKG